MLGVSKWGILLSKLARTVARNFSWRARFSMAKNGGKKKFSQRKRYWGIPHFRGGICVSAKFGCFSCDTFIGCGQCFFRNPNQWIISGASTISRESQHTPTWSSSTSVEACFCASLATFPSFLQVFFVSCGRPSGPLLWLIVGVSIYINPLEFAERYVECKASELWAVLESKSYRLGIDYPLLNQKLGRSGLM